MKEIPVLEFLKIAVLSTSTLTPSRVWVAATRRHALASRGASLRGGQTGPTLVSLSGGDPAQEDQSRGVGGRREDSRSAGGLS